MICTNPRPRSVSEHEGLIVDSGPHRFRILNGQRIWLSPIPPEVLRDIAR